MRDVFNVFVFALAMNFFVGATANAMVGLAVGDDAPEIELPKATGGMFKLSERDDAAIVLIFYRGSWCPYCMKQLIGVEKELTKAADAKDTKIVGISVDRIEVAKRMKKKHGLKMTILSDPKAKSLKDYKIANKLEDELVEKYKNSYKIDVEGDSGETHHIVAHPAVFVVKKGKITFADVHVDYKKRTKNSDIKAAFE